jgi:hypothetical protein
VIKLIQIDMPQITLVYLMYVYNSFAYYYLVNVNSFSLTQSDQSTLKMTKIEKFQFEICT